VRGEKGSLGAWRTIEKAIPAFVEETGATPPPQRLAPVE
jgi:hypothetical protein